ncbi:hypothetical protein [Aurantibacillus circumpalustris]|uniref:hypothetical protein n=1 Tax=Aurantibacillus circumpalustris TaxID=3036359 RepID=UPI00295BD1E1|nr:hypothetical protein [Aurantibacillus circumpalustris]
MKKVTLFLFITSLSFVVSAQKPEKIYGNAHQQKPLSYYQEQSAAWKKVVDQNPKNAGAWYNYYYANRNMMFNDTIAKKREERWELVKKIVNEMEKAIPDSYEYNICKWQMGNHDQKQIQYLKKAAELGPDRTEHIDYMINQGELNRNISDRDTYSIKKFEAGLFSIGIIYYNYNVLVGLEKDAILLTLGDNDTYPIWYLQAKGIRKDVHVVNLSLILLDYYREKVFQELGIEKIDHVSDLEKSDFEFFKSHVVKNVASNMKNYPTYLALTLACEDKYTKNIQENLYLTGLAYVYEKQAIDNVAFLKKNFEYNFAFDYLDKVFYNEISPDMVTMINGNYIIPMLTLYDHYKLAGDNLKCDWIKAKLKLVSKGTENEAEVIKHIQSY